MNPLPEVGHTAPIGWCGSCLIDIVAGDLACTLADAVIAGICTPPPGGLASGSGLDALDRALQGAIGRLQLDGIFSANWGETLLLSSPPDPIRAGTVLMLGLGPMRDGMTKKLRRAIRIGTSQAVRVGAQHIAFSPARLEKNSPRFNASASARAVLKGIVDTVSATGTALQRWSFIVPPSDFEAVAEHFRIAFAAVVEH